MSVGGRVPAALSAAQARRIALAAQGFGDVRPTGRVDARHLRRVLDRVGLIQIDSVNVLVRSQELVLFARLGPHRRDLIPAASAARDLFEYWGHEASHLPVEMHPLFRWRMRRAEHLAETWGSLAKLARTEPGYIDAVLDEVRRRGPVSAGELSDPGTRTRGMWGRSRGKVALEWLFWCGRVAARRRPLTFERVYDIPERMIPAEVLARPTPTEHDAHLELLVRAARSLGVGTDRDLADYYRLNLPRVRPLLTELVEEGRLLPVAVEGWAATAYLHPEARLPRWVRARALLSPFDSLLWERARTERMFRFRYRLEIYVPAGRRVHGYYVLPFLLDDRLVARVDLKADRSAGALRVQAAFAEADVDHGRVAEELAAELSAMASWLGLEAITVGETGDLSESVRLAVG